MWLLLGVVVLLWQLEVLSINRHAKRMKELNNELKIIEFQRGVMIGYGHAKYPNMMEFSQARDIIGSNFDDDDSKEDLEADLR